ncbi:MAG: twin-arginine translocation signal domain-containing protein, partial [Caldilinea sp.]
MNQQTTEFYESKEGREAMPQEKTNLSRRNFLRGSALLGGTALFASQLNQREALAQSASLDDGRFYELADPRNILYTSCQNCNTGCGI